MKYFILFFTLVFYILTSSILPQSNSNIILAGESDIGFSDFAVARYLGSVPEITLISPNGGEEWYAGTTETITWTQNFVGNVEIQLIKGGLFHSSISGSRPNDSSMIWNIPFSLPSGSDYKIRIFSNNNIFDLSDNNFTINGSYISVTSPNGGEVWCGGTQNITWEDNISGNVNILLIKGGQLFLIISSSTPSDGSYTWNIPSGPGVGLDYLIKIGSVDDANIFDFSDSTFTIGCNINIVSPNGGEICLNGTQQDVTWSSINVIDVKIELSLNNGASWSTIIDSTASTGIYSWLVNASQTSNQALIKISDITNENNDDQSDNVFTIDIVPGVEDDFSGIPDSYKLLQNFPNPFNPSTTIYYGLPEESSVEITIYGVLGNEVMAYIEENQEAGYHRVEFNATGLPSGIYFYKLQAGDFVETKKMILLK